MEDFVKEAKEKPNTISWGSPPTGNPRIVGDAVAKEWGLRLRFVPQTSGAATDTALLGGHVDVKAGSSSDIAELKDAKILAVSSSERVPFLPDVPTFNEIGAKLGLPGTIPDLGTGRLIAVRSTMKAKHPEIFQKLAMTYKEAFDNPAYQEALKKTGVSLVTQYKKPDDATAQFRKLVADTLKFRNVPAN
jgi:tripartite-type tricarboxylate transporter receptor subunit TctC